MGVAASTAVLGSGLAPLKKLVPTNPSTNERHLRGINTNILNYEDASASTSGLNTQLTIGGSATRIPSSPLRYRRSIIVINNNNTGILYLGFDSSVTTSTGFPLSPGCALPMDLSSLVTLWGIGSTNIDCRILELG